MDQFSKDELDAILMLTDAAQKLERVLASLGIEIPLDERVRVLSLRQRVITLIKAASEDSIPERKVLS